MKYNTVWLIIIQNFIIDAYLISLNPQSAIISIIKKNKYYLIVRNNGHHSWNMSGRNCKMFIKPFFTWSVAVMTNGYKQFTQKSVMLMFL